MRTSVQVPMTSRRAAQISPSVAPVPREHIERLEEVDGLGTGI
ncbi:MAG TPA: hypothetical protein VHZ55_24725 [Bryobacteraceae bacterium]|nr:hypothetical protein [Bryobacteraceae bacterium]